MCSDGDPSSSELLMDDKSVESILTAKHQGVRSYYQLFQQVKLRRVELSTNVNTLLNTLLELDNVRDIRSAPVVNAFRKFKEILDSLQADQDEASRDLYVLYFHPTLLNSRAFFSFSPCNHFINKSTVTFIFI